MSIATRECITDGEVEENLLTRRTSIENGVTRRTTTEALELIARSETQALTHGAWYQPGKDFSLYAAAHDACRATKTRVKELNLETDELESINSATGLDVLLNEIRKITEAEEQPTKRHPAIKKAGHLVEVFSEFVTRSSGIIELLVPQSPEYRMTYGALLLVFKTIFKRKETRESLLAYFQKLSVRLPIVDFYSNVFPTNGMKMLVVSIYVEILNLLNEAIVYYRSNHLRQLRDAVLRPVETKFDQCIERISAEVDKLHELKDAAHVAQQADMKDLLESTGHVVGRLHENLTHSLTAFSSRISLLETRLETMAHQSSAIHAFHATTHALALADILLPAATTAQEQLALVRTQRFALSPKDHWYENGVIDAFTTWSSHGRSELLWIGGRAGNQDTWVTEMSIDLVDALRLQDLTLLHLFCDENTTPATLMKILVAQLLDNHPDIPFSQPANYNARRFRRATTFARLWTIFEALVNEVTRSVFVLIDRIEDCNDADDGAADVSHHLLPYLMGLARDEEHVSVIVTSMYEPPDGLVGDDDLRHFYRDTRRLRGKREG